MESHKYRPIHEISNDTETLPLHNSQPQPKSRLAILYLTNLFILVFGIIIGHLLTSQYQKGPSDTKHLVPSPADEAVDGKPHILTPHNHEFAHEHHNPYKGFPTPAGDEKWMELMDGYSIRVPKSSVDAVDLESIPLNDGSGHVWVSMNIYHHLHCLDSIRHQIADLGCKKAEKDRPADYFPPHIDHCIETLRQRLICQPDLGIRAVAWHPEAGVSVVRANNTVNAECIDWKAVQEWTKAHSFSPKDGLITQSDGNIYNGPWTPPPRCGE